MAKHFIIHLSDIGEASVGSVDGTVDRWDDGRVEWAAANDDGTIDGHTGSGTLADAAEAAEGRRVTLVVPGEGVLLAETRVPGASGARAQIAAKYALEEQLADDVDELHFALGQKTRDDRYPVAVIDRAVMDELGDRCAAAGLRPMAIVPQTLALPRFDATDSGARGWTALIDGEQAVVRLGGSKGFVADTDMLGLMLEGALHEARIEQEGLEAVVVPAEALTGTAREVAMTVFTTPDAAAFELPDSIEVEYRRCAHALELYASGIANAPNVNLLQGVYSPRTQFDKAWKPWRWSAGLAAALLTVLFVGRWLDYRQLAAEEAAIDAAIVATFEQALPGTPVRRPRRQMESALAGIGAGGSGGFTERFAQIAESIAAQPKTTLNTASVRGARFDLDLVTDSLPSLDALGSAINERGDMTMSVQSTTTENGGIRARVRIE